MTATHGQADEHVLCNYKKYSATAGKITNACQQTIPVHWAMNGGYHGASTMRPDRPRAFCKGKADGRGLWFCDQALASTHDQVFVIRELPCSTAHGDE